MIARTPQGFTRVSYDDDNLMADHVYEQDYPTHSKVLGPDGHALQYEPRPKLGFDLRRKE